MHPPDNYESIEEHWRARLGRKPVDVASFGFIQLVGSGRSYAEAYRGMAEKYKLFVAQRGLSVRRGHPPTGHTYLPDSTKYSAYYTSKYAD